MDDLPPPGEVATLARTWWGLESSGWWRLAGKEKVGGWRVGRWRHQHVTLGRLRP